MYSQYLQDYVQSLSQIAEIPPESVPLLRESLACFVGILGRAIEAETYPADDVLKLSVRLLLLDDGISRLPQSDETDRVHYLIAMGFEQTGVLLTRLNPDLATHSATVTPLENDYWYRLTLALLHYLAGGHRVQALSVLRYLQELTAAFAAGTLEDEYRAFVEVLRRLYSGEALDNNLDSQGLWTQLVFQQRLPSNTQERRIQRLALRIQERRSIVLESLGEGNSASWLARRIDVNPGAIEFWDGYLRNLKTRGITTFTNEQVGPGFDQWLRIENNVVVVLPTGSGKTIIGELLTALALANGQQVVWILPTRALVRQTRRELRRAFELLGVIVDELPTTEDFIPLFAVNPSQPRYVAVATPEKLAALLRVNLNAVANVGLVVFDEAQLLLKDSRGTVAESVLQQIHRWASNSRFVLMTAFAEEQQALQNFIERLSGATTRCAVLSSNVRPTRRIYGIVTDVRDSGKSSPLLLLYPPGIQDENQETQDPFRLLLSKVKWSATSKKTRIDIAQQLVRTTTVSGVRSVLFVTRKDSTEAQAKKLLKSRYMKSSQRTSLPQSDLMRLHGELGRESVIEHTALFQVAPHHAGLTPLEQHLVELWVRKGIIRTVIATPTLAQGVNLPFDLSIVSFVERRNRQTDQQEPLAITEIQNMLGRAGRAGQVSDGICLIAVPSKGQNPVRLLDRHRRYFFASQGTTAELIGLRRLITRGVNAKINRSDWLLELDGLDFSETQAIVSFVLNATRDSPVITDGIHKRLLEFPSLQQLAETELNLIVEFLEEVTIAVQAYCLEKPVLQMALERTGMPVEILDYYIQQLQASPEVHRWNEADKLEWLDQVVQSALAKASSRRWFIKLMENHRLSLEAVMVCVKLWRSGATLAEIEMGWKSSGTEVSTKLGEFLNHQLSIFAQFWGALAVCDDSINEFAGNKVTDEIFRQVQTFVREGVTDLRQLEWLRALGGLDRVLAHKLAEFSIVPYEVMEIRRYVYQQMRLWHSNQKAIPPGLQEPYRGALIGVLNEVLGTYGSS